MVFVRTNSFRFESAVPVRPSRRRRLRINVQSANHDIVSQTAADDDADLLPDLVRRNLTPPDRVENPVVIYDGFFVVFSRPFKFRIDTRRVRRPAATPKPRIMRFIGRVFRKSGSLGGKTVGGRVRERVVLLALHSVCTRATYTVRTI